LTTFGVNSQKLNKKEFQIALGNRIRQIREAKNISQTELGNLCDIERTNMNRIEAGNTNPTSFTLYIIAQKLEIDLSELFQFKPEVIKK
jgi:transcriptional regulator with XRE-family HTH domain